MNKQMQAKDIPEKPVLEFLRQYKGEWCFMFGPNRCIKDAWNIYIPPKLLQAKMKSLIKRGLVNGCACGCRGDFEITNKGLEYLKTL